MLALHSIAIQHNTNFWTNFGIYCNRNYTYPVKHFNGNVFHATVVAGAFDGRLRQLNASNKRHKLSKGPQYAPWSKGNFANAFLSFTVACDRQNTAIMRFEIEIWEHTSNTLLTSWLHTAVKLRCKTFM